MTKPKKKTVPLSISHPDLITEWDYDKNVSISPDQITFGSTQKAYWKCRVCGYEWFARIDHRSSGSGCPMCMRKINTVHRTKTQAQFVKEMHEVNPTVDILGKYVNTNTKILCKCKTCGYEWNTIPAVLLKGHGCKKCADYRTSQKQRITQEEFENAVSLANPTFRVIGQYTGNRKKIECECQICGWHWFPVASVISLKKRNCPRCSKHIINKSPEYYKKELNSIKPNIEVLGEYTGANDPILVRCRTCGYKWEPSASRLLNSGSDCPRCSKSSTSVLEQAIYYSFCLMFGDELVLSRDKSAIGKELDVYVKNLNIAVEYGSWFWHKDKLENDKAKRQACLEKNINLLTLYDDCTEDSNSRSIIKYSRFMGASDECIITVLMDIFEYFDLDFVFISNQTEEILAYAKEHSLKYNDKQFRQDLKRINSAITVLTPYVDSKTAMRFSCDKCGHVWTVKNPLNLVTGKRNGCPKCSYVKRGLNQRIDSSSFVKRVREKNPDIEVVGEYSTTKDHIECICRKCGHRWFPIAGSLITKHPRGCPCCGNVRTGNAQMKAVINMDTNEKFKSTKEAALSCGHSDGHCIAKACRGEQKTAYSYHWTYADD